MKRIYYIACLLLILLSSCRTITKVVEVPVIKTEYIVKEKTDFKYLQEKTVIERRDGHE